MRLVFRIDLRHLPLHAALCTAVALVALLPTVNAQEPVTASSSDTGSVTLASATPAAVAAPDTAVTNATAADTTVVDTVASNAADTPDTATQSSDLAADALSIPADAASVNDLALDDLVLSRQRGGFGGMLMVAATPQLMRGFNNGGNGVTLWDEIAPPSQLPVPVDVARSAQGNVTSYQRN
jgi:hypothetical protein